MANHSDLKDFEIINGELVKYHGRESVVRVPEGVVSIGEAAFTSPIIMSGSPGMPPPMISWGGMENPELSAETYTEAGGYKFIQEVYLPESVEVIKSKAFHLCVNLAQVHLPQNLKRICTRAFGRCYSLKHIDVPPNTVIEREAFYMVSNNITRRPG